MVFWRCFVCRPLFRRVGDAADFQSEADADAEAEASMLKVAAEAAADADDHVCASTFSECVSGDVPSSYVDMYNATSNSWTTYPAGLGQARYNLAAASLASGLVFFAGGTTGGCS